MAGEREKPVEKDSPGAPTLSLSDYKELLNRNLFSREQRKRKSESTREAEPDRDTANEREAQREIEHAKETGGQAEADIVLMGIVDKDGVTLAFLEDRRAGKTLTVKSGDTLAGGKVGKITLNALEFVVGEKTASIAFGSNLQGGVSIAKPLDTSSAGNAAKGGAVAPVDPTESILEKMKRKRQAEGNK